MADIGKVNPSNPLSPPRRDEPRRRRRRDEEERDEEKRNRDEKDEKPDGEDDGEHIDVFVSGYRHSRALGTR